MTEPRNINSGSAWCWQDKAVMRLIRETFSGKKKTTAVAIYQSLTELASNATSDTFSSYNSQIAKLSGKSTSTIKIYCKGFIGLGILYKENVKLDNKTNLANRWTLLPPSVSNSYLTSTNNNKQTSISNGSPLKEEIELEKHIYEISDSQGQKNHEFVLKAKESLRQRGARVS